MEQDALEVLRDIRALLLIERAGQHRRVAANTPEDEIVEVTEPDGEVWRRRKWAPALRDAFDEVSDVKKIIDAHLSRS